VKGEGREGERREGKTRERESRERGRREGDTRAREETGETRERAGGRAESLCGHNAWMCENDARVSLTTGNGSPVGEPGGQGYATRKAGAGADSRRISSGALGCVRTLP